MPIEADIEGKMLGTLQWVWFALSKSLYMVIRTHIMNANSGRETVMKHNWTTCIRIIYLRRDALCRGKYINFGENTAFTLVLDEFYDFRSKLKTITIIGCKKWGYSFSTFVNKVRNPDYPEWRDLQSNVFLWLGKGRQGIFIWFLPACP